MGLGAREKQKSRNYSALGEHMPPVLSKNSKTSKTVDLLKVSSLRLLSVLKALTTQIRV